MDKRLCAIEIELSEIKQKLASIEKTINNHILSSIEKLDSRIFRLILTLLSIGLGGGSIITFLILMIRKGG